MSVVTPSFSSRLSAVKPSPSMAAKQRVDAMRAAGRTVIDFSIGEPDFATPQHIVEAGVVAISTGQTRYTASAGVPALRAAIAAKLKRENSLTYALEQIVVGCGAKHVIYDALAATLNEGDEVIVPAPYWVSYPDMVALQGGRPVVLSCDEASGFKLSAQALEAAITPRTRWLILNSPNNPTGAVYSRGELQALTDVLLRHEHVWLLTDEIYEHFVYGGTEHVSPISLAPRLQERALLVNGFSKSYAMTGWRLGYGAGPVSLMRAITLLLSQSTSCACSVSQAAGIAALEGPQACVREAAAVFQTRRDCMVEGLRRVPGVRCLLPDGAFYTFPSVHGLLGARTADGKVLSSDVDVMTYLLNEVGLATIDGTSYGMPGHLRMSFATSLAQIDAGCAAMQHAVNRLHLPSPLGSTSTCTKDNTHA